MTNELTGHTSPDTAYVVSDYPYGFRLRTEIRYWVETKAGHGQRLVSQTRNPKKAGMPWNKPKAGTYSALIALYLDPATNYVEHWSLTPYDDESKVTAFLERFPLTCADERTRQTLDVLIARSRVAARCTWTVVSPGESTQTPEEQAEMLHKLTAIELHKIRTASNV